MVENSIIFTNVCAILLAAFVGILAFRDADKAPGYRRPIRLFQAGICFYFVLLYGISMYSLLGYALPERVLYYLRAGLFTRWGVILLLLVIAADVLTYLLQGKKDDI